mmetsp:Transcript_27516/g.56404  ORF Transcript_27516/g.56404 Transcript_27516/m.56404 type:complete len:207 (-) Transcript_27516:136-756(-)
MCGHPPSRWILVLQVGHLVEVMAIYRLETTPPAPPTCLLHFFDGCCRSWKKQNSPLHFVHTMSGRQAFPACKSPQCGHSLRSRSFCIFLCFLYFAIRSFPARETTTFFGILFEQPLDKHCNLFVSPIARIKNSLRHSEHVWMLHRSQVLQSVALDESHRSKQTQHSKPSTGCADSAPKTSIASISAGGSCLEVASTLPTSCGRTST